MNEGVEATLNQQRTYLEIQLNGGEITQNNKLNKSKREPLKPVNTEETASTQPVHKCTMEYNRWWAE